MSRNAGRTLLLIDDEPAQSRLVGAIAARAGWRTLRASNLDEALAIVEGRHAQPIDAVLVDQWAPDETDLPVLTLRDRDLRANAGEGLFDNEPARAEGRMRTTRHRQRFSAVRRAATGK